MFSRIINRKALKPGFAWMAALCLIPPLTWSQVPVDSSKIVRDSIQDARMDRMEWRTDRRFDQIEDDQELFDGSMDSLGVLVDSLQNQLRQLDLHYQSQSERLLLLGEEMEATRESSRNYQEKLKVTLWISGMIILVLLSASFLILLMYGLKTRYLLDRIRWKQKQIRKDLSALERHIRSELKAAEKAARKSARKASRKVVLDTIRKFKLKKSKRS